MEKEFLTQIKTKLDRISTTQSSLRSVLLSDVITFKKNEIFGNIYDMTYEINELKALLEQFIDALPITYTNN